MKIEMICTLTFTFSTTKTRELRFSCSVSKDDLGKMAKWVAFPRAVIVFCNLILAAKRQTICMNRAETVIKSKSVDHIWA